VVDQHDLASAEEALRDQQGAQHIVRHYASGVSNHVRFAEIQAE
jgi:hypothetical protein